ncbi:MAG: von Willebrand factor type A domain-containing protein [Chloroflexota bacterium]|nr:von Willebrand factor type A domain-containing protein [Chloroflexota bacterium]
MMRNDSPDPEMERRLRDHFSEEAQELQAPDDLWDRLESQLGEQQAPRFALLRGALSWTAERPGMAAAAAAVLVVAIGVTVWGLPGQDAALDDADEAATTAASTTTTTTTTASAGTTTTTTQLAAGAADDASEDDAAAGAAETLATTPTPDAVSVVESTPPATSTPPAVVVPTTTPTPDPTPASSVATQRTTTADSDTSDADAADAMADDAMDDADGMADDGMDDDGMADADYAEDGMDDMGDGMDSDGMADADYADDGMDDGMDDAMDEGDADAASAPQQPSATTFQDYERTGFVETSVDAVSTFSLDTDRTSYFLALNWARNGYTVEPESVRAEEWINSFDYGYAHPTDDRSFAISGDVVRHPLDTDLHLARIAFQAPEFSDDTPLNVTLVLDASGSMDWGNRVAIARAAAEAIRQSLGPDDRIAVVHFTTDVLGQYTIEHSAPDDGDVVWSISRLAAHDSTNVQAGLDLGVQLADAARRERPDAFNYIILMSDGVANVDATDPFAILESAADTDSRNPLRLITIGVGIENYNDYLLEQLAQHGNGWYRYLDNTEQARSTFSRENWLALSTPFADQTRAQVTWDPSVVKSWRIVGYENRVTPDHTFTQDRKEFAELPAGTATTVFYELELHEGAGLPRRFGSVEVRWVEPASGESRSQNSAMIDLTGVSFDGRGDSLRLGAIVGLAADRYSRLSTQVEGQQVNAGGVRTDLEALQRELDALSARLGSSEAYRDFDFLLDALIEAAQALAPSSGYSR